jgi:hypothetical protein
VGPDEGQKGQKPDQDDVSCAPESGQPPGGRDNPWDDDEPQAAGSAKHAFPTDHHEAPGDDL